MIIDFFQIVILSIVEGITEFLPVSSTGHILIFEKIFETMKSDLFLNNNFKVFFTFIIQLGAMLAVIQIFWKDIFPFTGSSEYRKEKLNLWLKMCISIIPAIFLIKIDNKIENLFYHPLPIAITLIFYGIILILIEKRDKNKIFKINNINDITFSLALGVGVFQCLAVIPGTSRSAATIIGAMLLGMNRDIATKYSFFLAIPTITGACFIKFLKISISLSIIEISYIIIGSLVAYLTSIIVIRKFMSYIRNHDFMYFGYYRIILGIVIIIFL